LQVLDLLRRNYSQESS